MIGIGLRFPAGQFHATPWDRHVNEGATEWPPSPWRLLRSLVAVWKIRAPHCGETLVRAVLSQLTAPPSFYLPPATTGHSRHYMRWYKKGPEDQTLVFDAFVCIDRQSQVAVIWPDAQLDNAERDVLSVLLRHLTFLGRTESWCEATLLTEDEAREQMKTVNCRSLEAKSISSNEQIVRILCPNPQSAFDDEYVAGAKNQYDPVWHLCFETAQLHAEKWSDPPGSSWVRYTRRADCFNPPPKPRTRPRRQRPSPQVVRYALDSAVLPLALETLPIAEMARAALMGKFSWCEWRRRHRGQQPMPPFPDQRDQRPRSPTFSGRDDNGKRTDDHKHAYYLPTDEDGDGRLDHLTVIAADGFDDSELEALDSLRFLKRSEELPNLNLLLVGIGRLDEFQPMPLAEAKSWLSATPFLANRFPKKRGQKKDSKELIANPPAFLQTVLREEVDRLCQRRNLPWNSDRIKFEQLTDHNRVFQIQPRLWVKEITGSNLRWRPIQFKRFRTRKYGDDGGRRLSGAFRITFPDPIAGPICLGHSSHFGLGLFVPEVRRHQKSVSGDE